MSSNTTYTVFLNGTAVEGETRSRKQAAIDLANARKGEGEVEVRTSAGNVVHTVPAPGTHAKPWTRTESVDGLEVEVPKGFVPAYVRRRVGAVVARAEDRSGWTVVTTAGDRFDVKTAAEARGVTNDLAAQRKAAKAAEAEEASAEADAA